MRATRNSLLAAKRLRRAMSPPEVRLWNRLRRSPGGLRFRRQYPVGSYVADFYCPAAKLVIEIDGNMHDSPNAAAHDHRKDIYLNELGLGVVRIAARDIFSDVDGVAQSLIDICAERAGPSTAQLR